MLSCPGCWGPFSAAVCATATLMEALPLCSPPASARSAIPSW